MICCKYCTPAEIGWGYHKIGDDPGINSLVGVVVDDGELPYLEVDCYYNLDELWTAQLPIAFCPFCGRRLRDA